MDFYTNLDDDRNIEIGEDINRVTSRRARHVSRDCQISYDHALAEVQATGDRQGGAR